MLKFFWTLGAVLTVFTAQVQAGQVEELFEQARTAYQSEKYAESAALFMAVAEALLKNKQPDKAYAIMNNAAIACMKGEDLAKAVTIYERITTADKGVAPETRLKAYKNLIVCHTTLNNQARKIRTIERMFKALPQMPQDDAANAHAQLADAYRRLELYAKAAASYGKAASMTSADKNPAGLAKMLTAQGLCLGNVGDFQGASASLARARELAEKAGEPQTLAESDSNLGILHWERGDYEQATQRLRDALSTEEKHALRRNYGVDMNNQGLVYKSIGNYAEAMQSFESALSIAQEVGNRNDEAIALANRALLYRMNGKLQESRADYRAALALYEDTGFKEGKAGVLLGMGKIAELEDRDLRLALDFYTKAMEIYSELSMPRGMAETWLQLGGVYKQMLIPGKSARDLVFDEAPDVPDMPPAEVLVAAEKAYTEALRMAEAINSREMQWAARQGLGFVLNRQDKPEEAYAQYMKAIEQVASLRTSLASVALLGEYMAGKEDLYTEAMDLCAKLYAQKKDNSYLDMQMRLDETLRNEVHKATAALVQMEFADAKKQARYKKLQELAQRQAKAEAAIPAVAVTAANVDAETRERNALQAAEAKQMTANLKKIDDEYTKQLAEWKKTYPQDAVMFESSARVDLKKVQAALKDDQIMLQYIPLQDKLIILAVSKTAIQTATVDVGIKSLNATVRKNFLVDYIEGYGRSKDNSVEAEQRFYDASITVLSGWYDQLVRPVETALRGKKRLYIVTSGFLSQIPFVALARKDSDAVRFLVEDFEISNVRPSFISALTTTSVKPSTKKLIAVGNPRNEKLQMASLDSAEREIQNASQVLGTAANSVSVTYTQEATEAWLKKSMASERYEYMYFATHGLPFSEVFLMYFGSGFEKATAAANKRIARLTEQQKETEPGSDAYTELQRKIASVQKAMERRKNEQAYLQASLTSNSPLNGLLYLGNNESEDGLLTIKEILEADDSTYASTKYVFLSACNTGVTYAPKTLLSEDVEVTVESHAAESELRKLGLIPGIDQVSFVDAFMRRNITTVYGTLWFADDKASSIIMSAFTKRLNDDSDAVSAYTHTLRDYITACREGNNKLGAGYTNTPLSPYYWAVGAVFGR